MQILSGVIPRPRAFTSGARDLAWIGAGFVKDADARYWFDNSLQRFVQAMMHNEYGNNGTDSGHRRRC
jgi:hypothetical protein